MNKQVVNEINEELIPGRKILITTHYNPDGDAIGSSLALFAYLRKLGHDVSVMVPNNYPKFLKWLRDNDEILIYKGNEEEAGSIIEKAEIIFSLDYNSFSRVEEMELDLRKSDAYKILIDHHLQPADDFSVTISEISASSTSELVYQFFEESGNAHLVDKQIAEALYVGIMTDTGSFSFANNGSYTYLVASKLVDAGIDDEEIHRKVYATFTESRLRLLGYCLSEKLNVLSEYKTAFISLTSKELNKFNYKTGDAEGIVNYALSIEGVIFAILLTERDGHIRLSFRSKDDFSVNLIACKHFEGGGHRNAAGGNFYGDMDGAIKKLTSILHEYPELSK